MNILITGTSSGIGFGLAKYYLDKNYQVIGVSRTINHELERHNTFQHIQLDLSNFEFQKQKLGTALSSFQSLDLVVLNAGVLPPIKDMKDVGIDVFKRVMDVNVWANKVLIDLLYNKIEELKQIVAISSGASKFGNRGWNAYSISKAALNMLVKLYAKEYKLTHFSAIAPGLVDTGMQDYIYTLKKDERFPSVDRLQAAKGTPSMPEPERAAPILAESFVKALSYESGSYLDVREMN